MKKLNRKGFTLIELLAVIVILAIIVVVTVPTIINSISDARVNSIWNLAGSTANSYDTMAAQELLASDQNKVLKGIENDLTTSWQCIHTLDNSDGVTLDSILDLSSNDVVLTGTTAANKPSETFDSYWGVTATTCSSIRKKANGSVEILLVAATTGKFNISGKVVYAVSSEDQGVQK